MAINDDFTNKAEAEMKLHDAKMMEQAKIRKLSNAPVSERIAFALSKTGNDAEKALDYLKENHMIRDGENISMADVKAAII